MNIERAKKWAERIMTAASEVATGDIKKIELAIYMLPIISNSLRKEIDLRENENV